MIPLQFVLLNLERVERKRKNSKNLNIPRTKRPFEMKQKTLLIVFEELSFGEKIKNW